MGTEDHELKAELKAALRRDLATRLKNLDATSARRGAEQVAARVLRLPEVEHARSVLTCLSFGTELDTWVLVDQLLASGRRIYVPRVERRGWHLHAHAYPCELKTLSFGLRQPTPNTPALSADQVDETIDAVLVLGMAFDRQGYRLGHGAGYFDRFLAKRRFPSIGLAYDVQLLERLPVEEHDVAMSVVVTESETLRPTTNSR